MLFSLVKKDFILVKRYLLFALFFAVAAPIFLTNNLDPDSSMGFLTFFITTLYIEHMLLNTLSFTEDKYKGGALLSATPYTRVALVKSKYAFMLAVFVGTYILYTFSALFLPFGIENISIFAFGMSLLLISIAFGSIIPIQYKFGYDKTKYISFSLLFIAIFVVPKMVNALRINFNGFEWSFFPDTLQIFIPFLLSILVIFLSMMTSIAIYSRKDL